jgi:hypothetical protein
VSVDIALSSTFISKILILRGLKVKLASAKRDFSRFEILPLTGEIVG